MDNHCSLKGTDASKFGGGDMPQEYNILEPEDNTLQPSMGAKN